MFEAYAVGVRLTLINEVSSGLFSMASHFTHLHHQFDIAQGKADKFRMTMLELTKGVMVGGALTAVGVGAGALLMGPYEEAKKLAQARAKFMTLNLSAKDNEEAFAIAGTISQKVMGTAIADNIGLVQDLHTAFGDLHHAVSYAPALAEFLKVAQIQNGEHAGDGLVYNAVKAIEHRGGKRMASPELFNDELSRMSQVYVGSGGRVSPSDYFHASQTGKMAYSLASPEFLYGPFAAYAQAKSGSTAGTAMMTAFMSLAGGHMDHKAKDFFGALGLGDEHGLKSKFVEQYTAHPDQFIWTVLEPAIKKRFGMNMTNEQIAELIARNTNRNTGDFLGWFIMNESKAKKDTAIFNKSMSYTQAYKLYNETPEGAEQAYHAAMRNFKAVVGTAYLPMIVDGLKHLAPVLMNLAEWAKKHQGTVKVMAAAVASLGALALVAGGLVLFATSIGAVRLAIGALGGGQGIAAGAAADAGVLGNLGLYAGGAWGAYQIGKLGFAVKDWWDAEHHEGVTLTKSAAARINPVPPGGGQLVQVHTTLKVNERVLGQSVATHMGREASRPQSSSSAVDPGWSVPMRGVTNKW